MIEINSVISLVTQFSAAETIQAQNKDFSDVELFHRLQEAAVSLDVHVRCVLALAVLERGHEDFQLEQLARLLQG